MYLQKQIYVLSVFIWFYDSLTRVDYSGKIAVLRPETKGSISQVVTQLPQVSQVPNYHSLVLLIIK